MTNEKSFVKSLNLHWEFARNSKGIVSSFAKHTFLLIITLYFFYFNRFTISTNFIHVLYTKKR
jgi:hypothetical protein